MTLGGHSRWQRSLGAAGRVSRLREVAKALGFLGGGVPRAPQSPRALPPQERRPFSESCTAASESFLSPHLLSLHPGPPVRLLYPLCSPPRSGTPCSSHRASFWFTSVNQAIMPEWPARGFKRQGYSWAQRAEKAWERSQGKRGSGMKFF